MIKRIFLLISISLVTVLSAHADGTFTFNLNADKMSDTQIYNGLCSVTAKVDDNGKLVVILKNISEEGYSLHLFKHEFSKKQLKNRKISVAKGLSSLLNYDRTYHLDDFSEDNYKIDVDDSENIIEVSVPDNTSLTYKLPVYVSVKVKKGFLFWKKTVNEIRNLENLNLEININLEKKPSEAVLRLGHKCDELISNINNASICNKTGNHSNGWTSKKDWENKIKELKQSINELKDNNGWYKTDTDGEYCKELTDKLDEIVLTTSNCPKHKGPVIPTHGCKYCKMSMEEINTQIRKIYNNMRNSNNHQKIKEEHMKEVQDMYKCSTSSKRSKAQNANIRDRIKRAYEEFINY